MRSRQYAVAVIVCAAAAALALYAASRTWLVEVVARPDPLPPTTAAHTGATLAPLLPALALVGLAGAGGLLASRGKARTAVAGLLVLVGLGIPISVAGTVGRSGVALGWALGATLAGLAVAAVGALAIARGGSWPTMGARYERTPNAGKAPSKRETDTHAIGIHKTDTMDIAARDGGRRDDAKVASELWAALDRGEDPTKG